MKTLAHGYEQRKKETIDQFIGRRVHEERTARTMSQRALAHTMDIAAPHLSNLEKGLRGWTAAQIVKAAGALGVEPAALLTNTEGLNPTEAALVAALRSGDAVAAAGAFAATLAANAIRGK